MGSTGEPERKRRHVSSISSPAKKSSFSPFSEDKKLDAVVLQYQNQKLVQQLEAQNVECVDLENKLELLKKKQNNYDETLEVVGKSWEQLIEDLESLSFNTKESIKDGASCPTEDDFLCRIMESGVPECCSQEMSTNQMNNCRKMPHPTARNIIRNMLSSIDNLWHLNEVLSTVLLGSLPEDEPTRQLRERAHHLQTDVKCLWTSLRELHLKHRHLANELQIQRDAKAKNKSEQKRLIGELESINAALKESKNELVLLKTQKDAGQRVPYPFPSLGSNHVVGDKVRDKEKEMLDLQSAYRESMDLASSRLLDIRELHEKRVDTLKRLCNLQNTMSDVHCISSSNTFQSLSDRLAKSKLEMDQCQSNLEELQVEKDCFIWREREMSIKLDLADVSRVESTVANCRVDELEKMLRKQADEKVLLDNKLEQASREPGRNETMLEFKALVSALPKDMDAMQSEMSRYKEDSSELYSLRAEVRSLRNILERKLNELDVLSRRSCSQLSDIEKLQASVQDLKETDQELKLFLDMYKCESSCSRDFIESRDSEYKAWAYVQSLQSSLDEHSLELRVKAANEAEAISQQKLATAEAEIADLRQKLETSGRDLIKLSETLNSKREEGEAYLSEIESIGQAWGDVQAKNQQLLEQVTERDDYNIKLSLDCVKSRQVQDALRIEIETINWELQQASTLEDVYSQKFAMLDDQLRIWTEQVGKLADDGRQSSVALEHTERRLLDIQRENQHLKQSLDEMQGKINISRQDVSELHVEIEEERFNKRRVEEDLEVVTRKASYLRMHSEGLSVLTKLRQELGEYKGILKCGSCHDRQKEVVIAKCYHLFCNPCIRRTLESRHRKCPACGVSFGPNDVKPIYI